MPELNKLVDKCEKKEVVFFGKQLESSKRKHKFLEKHKLKLLQIEQILLWDSTLLMTLLSQPLF